MGGWSESLSRVRGTAPVGLVDAVACLWRGPLERGLLRGARLPTFRAPSYLLQMAQSVVIEARLGRQRKY